MKFWKWVDKVEVWRGEGRGSCILRGWSVKLGERLESFGNNDLWLK